MGLLDWNKIGPQGGDYSLLTEDDRFGNAMRAANQGFMAMMEADRQGLPGIQSMGAFGGAMAPSMQAYSEQSKDKRVDERTKAAWKALADADPGMDPTVRTAFETGDPNMITAFGQPYIAAKLRAPKGQWEIAERRPNGDVLFRNSVDKKPLLIKAGDTSTMAKMIDLVGQSLGAMNQKKLGQAGVDRWSTGLEKVDFYQDRSRRAQEFWDIGEEMDWETGPITSLRNKAIPYLQEMGVSFDPKTISDVDLQRHWESLRTQEAVQLTKDYKGAISNREIQLFLDAQVSPGDPKGAVQRKIVGAMLGAEFLAAKEEAMADAAIGSLEDYTKVRAEWRENNSLTVEQLVKKGIVSGSTFQKYMGIRAGAGAATATSGDRVGIMTEEEIEQLD